MFQKILIANRGEIAVRIIQACQELGIATVAVYSEPDRFSLHVLRADEAVHIGPASALESYLNQQKIIAAAHQTGAQAIHPGYGFLSENSGFAAACAEAGLVFIGPPPDAIRKMGNKREAKEIMEKAGVPVVPGYYGADQSTDNFQKIAEDIGYPVMIKAAAGGGGKGMRIVKSPAEMVDAVEGARREAKAAFGDDTVFLEKYIENPRHIEFQVLADQHGHTIHLLERECSIQRRHQKVLEETPSVALTPALREEMGQVAVRAAEAVQYTNAGTIEFIFDDRTQSYYFLEMNTRLQVEHSVTEMTTGIDLVHWQIRIADGEKLTIQQNQITHNGHAIEVRLYAEDPSNGFLPQTGLIRVLQPPTGPNLRHDLGIHESTEVTMYYDPILAKLTVFGATREDAIRRLSWALRNYSILGIRNNMNFLTDVVEHPEFKAGRTTTHFIDMHMSDWHEHQAELSEPVQVCAALAELLLDDRPQQMALSGPAEGDLYNPWQQLPNWRN